MEAFWLIVLCCLIITLLIISATILSVLCLGSEQKHAYRKGYEQAIIDMKKMLEK